MRSIYVAGLALLITAASALAGGTDAVIEPEDVAATIRAAGDDVVILDARPLEAYETRHLRRATYVDYDAWVDLAADETAGLDHLAPWHRRLGALGIDADDLVIVYDGGEMTRVARIWFILQHTGVRRAAVINGGYPAMEADADAFGLRLTALPTRPRTAVFEPDGSEPLVGHLGRAALRDALERGAVQVFDARSADEHARLDLKTNDRGGHLPGAINLPHLDLLDERGRLRPADELADLLERAGFERGRPIVTHCQSGGRASLAALAAARAGFGPVLNYYLSFGDWAADASCPVVTPEHRPDHDD